MENPSFCASIQFNYDAFFPLGFFNKQMEPRFEMDKNTHSATR